jgi:hypothetical protein
MKHPTIAVLVVALLGVAVLGDVSAQNGSSLIVAGQSIGQTHLGRFGATYLAKLPKPDADDSGMGKYRSVWLSKNQAGRKETLYIFSVANDPRDIQPRNGVSIRLIRVTSPWYHTANSISTGNALPQILRSSQAHAPPTRARPYTMTPSKGSPLSLLDAQLPVRHASRSWFILLAKRI